MYSSVIVESKEIAHPWCVGQKVRILPNVTSNPHHPSANFMVGKEGILLTTKTEHNSVTHFMGTWDCKVQIWLPDNENSNYGKFFFLFEELELIE